MFLPRIIFIKVTHVFGSIAAVPLYTLLQCSRGVNVSQFTHYLVYGERGEKEGVLF